MAVNDKYKITVVGLLHSQYILNVFHFNETTAVTSVSPPEQWYRDAFKDWINPEFLTLVSNQYQWVETVVQRIRPTPQLLAHIFAETSLVGTQTGEALPPQDAAVITLYGTFGRRADRGRKYFAGLPEADHTSGVLTSAALGRLQALATALDVDEMGHLSDPTARARFVIHSKKLNKQPRDEFPAVVKTLARGTVRTQRRRQLGRGI